MNTQIARKEYRGQRTAEAIADFIRKQIQDPVQIVTQEHELATKVRQRDSEQTTPDFCSIDVLCANTCRSE